MSDNITGTMVETRNISRSQDSTMEALQESVRDLQENVGDKRKYARFLGESKSYQPRNKQIEE